MTTSQKTPPDPNKPTKGPGRMKRLWGPQWLWSILRCCFFTYLGLLLLLAFVQRSLMYPATQTEKIGPQAAGFQIGRVHSISMQTSDGLTLHGWHILPEPKIAVDQAGCDELLQQDGPVVLFFHGNGGNRIHRGDDYQILSKLKCHIITFDYRGYGENPGTPSETKLTEDAMAAWKYLSEERKVPASRVILCGESLGGGVATRLAADVCDAKTPPGGLILRSTFSSMVDAASQHYPWLPVRFILVDRYMSINRIPHVTCPILIIHGAKDTIVPFKLGQRLFDAAPAESASGIAKTFVELPHADHNDYLHTDGQLFQESLAKFLAVLKSQNASQSE